MGFRGRGGEKQIFEFYRASDSSSTCRHVLDRLPGGAEHLVGDMLGRFKSGVLSHLRRMLAEAQRDLKSKLSMHAFIGGEGIMGTTSDITYEVGRDFVLKAWAFLKAADPLEPNLVCYKHGGQCPSWPDPAKNKGKLVLAVASTTCTPWSRMGSRKGWIHEATFCFLLWAREIIQHKPHVVVQECTVDFDDSTFESMMDSACGPTHWLPTC